MHLSDAFPRLARLDADHLEELCRGARPARFPAGRIVFQPEQPCQSYLFVFGGMVRVQKIGESGRVILLYRVEAGETCLMTTSCLMSAKRYSAEGIVERDLECALLREGIFQSLMSKSGAFRGFIFSAFADRMTELLDVIDDVTFRRIDSRLAEALLDRAQNQTVLATHQDLADDVGTSREVVSRHVKQWESRGVISAARGRIRILRENALRILSRL